MKMANPQNLITWQTILLIVSSFNLPKVISTQDSCKGRCASSYDRGYNCNCDAECLRYGECCKDYRALCTSEISCSGRCFEMHERGRKCQCDLNCKKYGDCCPDFVANCGRDIWKSSTFRPTTSLLFTSFTRKPTAEQSEIISDTLFQQDSASHLDDKAKIKEEPIKPKNGSAQVIEGSTIINPIRFEVGKDDSKILDKGITSRSPVNASMDSKTLDNRMATLSVLEDGTIDSKISVKIMTTSVPEDRTMDPKTLDNRMTTYSVPEDRSTNPKILDKGIKTNTVLENTSTNPNILDKELTTVVPEDGITDSMFLDKGMITASSVDATSIAPIISDTWITTHTAPEEISSVPGILDKGMTALPSPENRSNDSKMLDKVTNTVPESDSFISKIPYDGMTVPSVAENVSKSSKALGNRMTTPSVPANYSTNSKILDKGLTTTFIPQDVSTDSKIVDRGMTTNTNPKEVSAGTRILASGMTTSVLPAAASTNARIVNKETTSLSIPITSPADNMVIKVPLPTLGLGSQTTGKTQSYEDSLNDPNLCNKKPSDALTTLQNGTTYIFRGHLFWTISQKGQTLGHPRRITDVWGIPSPIDTVFTRCNCNGNTYFLKGEQYWRFQNGVMDNGYPRKIAAGFSGLNGKIIAALSVAAHSNRPETVYFFKEGGLYQKYVYQRSLTTCPQERPPSYTYQVVRQRYRRQTMVVVQKNRKLQKIAQLSAEMSIRKNWHGFPVRITSAISLPNHRLAEKYEYYVLSRDKSYKLNPVNQKATYMKRSITKDLYECN